MSSINKGSSDESNDQYGLITSDNQWSQDCQIMSDSGSDDDINEDFSLKHHETGSNDKEFSYDSDFSTNQRQSYDTDTDTSYSKRYKKDFNDGQTNSSVSDVECYSPSKELRRQSVEYRNSYDNYSPHPSKKVKIEDSEGTSWSSIRHTSHSEDLMPPHSVNNIIKHSSEETYSSNTKPHDDKTRKNSKSSNKRKHEDSPAILDYSNDSTSNFITSSGTSLDTPLQGGIGASIMGKMGYQSGTGLGKHGQGRVDPVELSKQKGRQGLGVTIPNLDVACKLWKPSLEVINVKEEIEWLNSSDLDPAEFQNIDQWSVEGPRNNNISEMTDFCDANILSNILSCKDIFDSLQTLDVVKARSRSNPFETIRKGIFLNRAAMKMANMDAIFDFMFTKPVDMNGAPMVADDKLLYFADVCAGPGGFSEYILWRKQWKAKGIGFTLRGENDFNLDEFKSGPPESFEPYYGEKGNGDVFDPENISDLTKFVMKVTGHKGVHFMMADGGFSVDGQENIQELLSKQLYLCQFLVALFIVRVNGHFVCKLFDIFSPFSVGLIYLMYRCFHQICIFKPNTSRPANSERYIVCKWKRHDTEEIRDYMFELNTRLCELGSSSKIDINHCVPSEIMFNDTQFIEYIITSNNRLGERQIISLAKISAYYRTPQLTETKQFELRKACLSLWEVPDKITKSDKKSADDILQTMFFNSRGSDFLKKCPTPLTPDNLEKAFGSSIYDWQCIVLGSCENELTYFLGLGRGKIAKYNANMNKWSDIPQCNFELSPGTLVLGERVTEYIEDGRFVRKCPAFHFMDAYSLGKEQVAPKEYNERTKYCDLYSKALMKLCTPNLAPLRVIKPIPLEQIDLIFKSVFLKEIKGIPQCVIEIDDFEFVPKGILFFNPVKAPWAKHKSRSTQHYYYASPKLKESHYENMRPKDSIAEFKDTMASRIVWWWESGVGMKNEDRRRGVVHKDDIVKLIDQKLNKINVPP